MSLWIVAIIFGSSLASLAIIGGTIIMAIKLLKGDISREERKVRAEEAKMIQEIYQSLPRMEQRIEALETLVLDREGKERAQ